ncbi:MAG: peptidase, partial [Planifilum fulgidum]
TDAIRRLKYAGVKVNRLKKAAKLTVESYIVTGKETQDRPYEGHPQHQVTTKVVEKTVVLPKGSWIIPMDQPTANLAALAMEPESTDSYVTFGFIPSEAGEELPVYRYMGGGSLR